MTPSASGHRVRLLRITVVTVASMIAVWLVFQPFDSFPDFWFGKSAVPMARPGIAPAAFKAYLHACHAAAVNPERISQTIGDSPRSFGYHHKDGALKVESVLVEYCAATDIHVFGLREAEIATLVRALGQQGFACWYRRGGKWQGIEHIHAVYAFVPMKPQLEKQVELYLREQKPHWTRKWKRSRFNH